MAITKNPIYYLWLGAVGRWVGQHKKLVGTLLVLVCASAAIFIWSAAQRRNITASNVPSIVTPTSSLPYVQDAVANCPGTLIESVVLRGREQRRLSEKPCQVRIKILRGNSVFVFGKDGSKLGEFKRGAGNIDGIIYAASAGDGLFAEVMVTVCPLGSPGGNMGSCN